VSFALHGEGRSLNTLRVVILLFVAMLPPMAVGGCGAASATPDDVPPATAGTQTPMREVAAVKPAASVEKPREAVAAPANDRVVDKTFDDIKFDIQPDAPFDLEMLTPEIEALAGQRVRIRGYILPTPQKHGIKQFVLVRDNQECCFGPGAALYDCVLVEMQPGKVAEFSIRPVAVEGVFGINLVKGPDDKPLAIYRIEGERVR
jgi:hypothetical protein